MANYKWKKRDEFQILGDYIWPTELSQKSGFRFLPLFPVSVKNGHEDHITDP